MLKKIIIKPTKSPATIGPRGHAVRVRGLLSCSGQIPVDPKDGKIVARDVKMQTEVARQNMKTILDDMGLKFASVAKSTVFLGGVTGFEAWEQPGLFTQEMRAAFKSLRA